MNLRPFIVAAMVGFACLVLSACTQTAGTSQSAISSYSGNIGKTALTDKQRAKREASRQAKKDAARKRAVKAKEKRRAAFLKKREDAQAERKARLEERNKKSAKPGKKTKKAQKAQRTKTKAKVAKAASRKKTAIKTKKSANKATNARTKAAKKKVAAKPVKKSAKKTRTIAAKKKSTRSTVKSIKPIKASYAASAGTRVATGGNAWNCVPGRLKTVLGQVARKYGSVTINSTHRSSSRNRMVGGKRRSYHLNCQAVDFRVHGNTKGLTRFLAQHKLVGGYKRYPAGYYHIDTGPKRTW